MTVEVTQQVPDWPVWLSLRDDATLLHDPRWGRLMQEVYGNRPWYLTARRDDLIVGVLQLVEQRSLLFGSHLCSIPYFDAAGILADDDPTRHALLLEARRLRQDCRCGWVELRHEGQAVLAGVPSRTDKVTLRLFLPGSSDDLWKALNAKVRNQVRKAQKGGLVGCDGGMELLGEFHRVYVRNMRDLGSPPHSLAFFRGLMETFGPACRVFVVRKAGQALAASLTLRDRLATRVPWAGSDWRFRQLNANMLMYWNMLARACDSGSACFDFGRSKVDAGTYRFKKQWGAHEVALHWHYLMPPGKDLPELRPDSPKYRLMVSCWKKLPVCLARILGPRILGKLA